MALSLCRGEDRPRFGHLNDCSLGELGFAVGHWEYRRLAPPMAEKNHLPRDILVGQRAPRVLTAPDCDFDRSRIVTRKPHLRPGRWRDARSDCDRPSRKPDTRTTRAPIAAAHEPRERPRLKTVALDTAVDDDLRRIDVVTSRRMGIAYWRAVQAGFENVSFQPSRSQ